MPWTRFMDMHSGGRTKEKPYEYIYIEASHEEAQLIFYNRFGHNPNRVSCTCCGEDYSIDEYETLEQATGFERGCIWYSRKDKKNSRYFEANEPVPDGWQKSSEPWGKYRTLDKYKEDESVLIISSDQIKPDERRGELPTEGYVWV